MTRAQTERKVGEAFDRLCTLACERMPVAYSPQWTRLQHAASWLVGFAVFCRNNLIDPTKALEQACILLREQPTRTPEDYAKEAQAAAEAAQANPAVPGSGQSDVCTRQPHDGNSAG